MQITAKSFRAAAFTMMAIIMSPGGIQVSLAADVPSLVAPNDKGIPALSTADYLDRYADLLLLRERFGAVLGSEVPDLMRAKLESFDQNGPQLSDVVVLRNDLMAELNYYAVNLRYLILAEGAIWPSDRSVSTYRNDALSALSEVIGELAAGDVMDIDINHLLHRLESVNAWTEGVTEPADDWFSAAKRQSLVDAAMKAAHHSSS